MSEKVETTTTTEENTNTDHSTTSSEETTATTSQDTQTEEQSSNLDLATKVEEKTDGVEETKTEETTDENKTDEIEDYDLELSEDSPLTQTELDAIAEYAGKNNLTKEQAEEMIKGRENLVNQGMDIYKKRMEAKHKELSDNFLADKDFNDENRQESFVSIKRAVDKFGNDDLREALKDPVIGNNIALGKFLKNIGDLIGPEGFEGLKPNNGGPSDSGDTRTERMKRMYPNHFEEK